MSDLILVESVNSVISNINEDNNTFKSDKTYNIDILKSNSSKNT